MGSLVKAIHLGLKTTNNRLLASQYACLRVPQAASRFLSSNSQRQSEQQASQDAQQTETPDQKTSAPQQTVDKAEYDKVVEQFQNSDAKYKRSLADMENLRARLQRELESSKKFAIQKFCKDLIEVTDVMGIALEQIKPEAIGQSNYDGIKMIETRTRAIFEKHGLISLRPTGEKFDPNEHHAVYEAPDATKEPGTVSETCKEGWKLHDRIVRPAMVGVYKKPDK